MSIRDLIVRTNLNLAFCFYLFLGLALPTRGHAGEYYIYQDPNGKLVISNQQPPPGSNIRKQQTLPDISDSEVRQAQERDDTQPNETTEGSTKPSKDK